MWWQHCDVTAKKNMYMRCWLANNLQIMVYSRLSYIADQNLKVILINICDITLAIAQLFFLFICFHDWFG